MSPKTAEKSENSRSAIHQRIGSLKRRIAEVDLVCCGTLLQRTKVCGKSNCRCATDPDARHGPYYEWNRLVDGKLRHTIVSPGRAREIKRALENHRRILKIVAQWQQESINLILRTKS